MKVSATKVREVGRISASDVGQPGIRSNFFRVVEVCKTHGCALEQKTSMFARPVHPYTRALLSAVPVSHPDLPRHRHILRGNVPSATAVPKGCRFAPRCRFAEARCHERDPELTILADGRAVACLLAAEGTLPAEVPP